LQGERWPGEETTVASAVQILQMERVEIPQVVDLWNEAIRAPGEGYERHAQSSERVERIFDDPNFLPEGALVARQRGELVGFALGYVQTADFLGTGSLESTAGRLAGIAVRPDRWRQGIGRSLLRAIEDVLAENGKSAVSFSVYHAMPLALVRSIHLDSGPYHFLRASGYADIGHELVFYNDIAQFELQDWVIERRERLEGEGITFRWYGPQDRSELLEFMTREFAAVWQGIIKVALTSQGPPEILLALASGQIVGFIGPFDVRERGRFYFTTDSRAGWGSFGSPGVASALRRRGIGTVLWHLGLDHLRRSGVRFTEYGTDLDNPARVMYLQSGARLMEVGCVELRKSL